MPGGLIADLMVRFGADTSPAARQMREMQRMMDDTGRKSQTMGDRILANRRKFQLLGAAAAAMGTALIFALTSMGNEAIRFESTITRLSTQIGLTAGEVAELRSAALSLQGTGKGAQELGDAAFFVASAGLRGRAALDALEHSARASSVGLGETATVADLVTSAMNAYGHEVLGAENATDVLMATVREGKAEAPELAASLGRVLPVASEMGVQFWEVGAAVAAMTRTGSDAATANTQLRAIMVSLLKPAEQSAQMLEEVGLSAAGLRDTIREDGLWQALMDVREAVGDNDEALARIFPNVRALAGFLDLTGANAAETAEIFERMAETTGLTSDAFEEWSTTTEAAQDRASAAWENARIQFGEATLGMRSSIAETSESVATWLNSMDDSSRRVAVGVAGISGAALLAGGTLLMLLPRIVETTRAARDLGLTMTNLRAFMVNPWVIGIGVAAVAVFALRDALKEGRQAGLELANEIRATADTAEDAAEKMATASRTHGAEREKERGWIRALLPPLGLLRERAEQVGVAYELNRQAVRELDSTTVDWIDTQREMHHASRGTNDALAEMADAVRDTNPELAAMIDGLDDLGEGAEEAAGLLDFLTESQKAATTALATGVSDMKIYQENLAALNETGRQAAEDEAQRVRDEIQRQIDRTDATTKQGEKRIKELEKEQRAVEAHYTDLDASWDVYVKSLEQALKDQREWHANLNTIREAAGDDYADMLTAQGPEFAGLHAEIAKQEHGEIQQAAATALKIRDEANMEALNRLIRAGVEFVDETGNYSREAVSDLAKELGVAPSVVERLLDQSNEAGRVRLERMQRMFGTFGQLSGQELASKLGESVVEVARIARQYGINVAEAIEPLLAAIGDARTRSAVRRFITTGARPTGLNTGGFVPGSGPDRDSVPAWLTPGEFVVRRKAAEEIGPQGLELLNRGLADIVPRFNVGGRVTGDISGLDARFLRQLQTWAADMRDTISVTSGWRSRARQAALFARFGPGRAARPGFSQHEVTVGGRPAARAADMQRWGGRGPRRHGIHFPLGHEPWHAEPVWARSGVAGTPAGPGDFMSGWIEVPRPPRFPREGIGKSADFSAAHMRSKVQEWADANAWAPAFDTGAPVSAAQGSLQQMAREMLNRRGWGGQWPAFNSLVQRESSWNPRAQNPTSTAFGLMQFLNSTWASTGIAKTTDPALQLEAGMRYIAQRYGDPNRAWAFWQRNRWYNRGGLVDGLMARGGDGAALPVQTLDNGGWLPTGASVVLNNTGAPESVKNSGQLAKDIAREIAAVLDERGGDTNQFFGVREDEIIQQLERRDRVRILRSSARAGR